jgi:2-methylisocitrate lyase-like PEP mutase family enzyme
VAAFAEAGADVLFIDALETQEEMRGLCSAADAAAALPKVWRGDPGPPIPKPLNPHFLRIAKNMLCRRASVSGAELAEAQLGLHNGSSSEKSVALSRRRKHLVIRPLQMANMLEGGGKTPILAPAILQDIGFKLVAYPLSLLGVSIRAMQNALADLKVLLL